VEEKKGAGERMERGSSFPSFVALWKTGCYKLESGDKISPNGPTKTILLKAQERGGNFTRKKTLLSLFFQSI
jgi:hypothetical protein